MNQIYGRNEIIHKVVDKLHGEKIVVGGNKHAYKRKYHLKYSIPVVKHVINALLEVLTEILEDGDEASFRGYLTITPEYCSERRGWNVYKNEPIMVSARYRPRVKVATYFNDACKRLTERELGGLSDEENS